jgi:hypothetical protein
MLKQKIKINHYNQNNANHKETNFWLEKVRRFPQELEDHCIAAASGQLPRHILTPTAFSSREGCGGLQIY